MAYATADDLDAAQGAETVDLLTFDDTGQRDQAKIARALDDATAIVNSYVARRYPDTGTFSPAGLAMLAAVTADIAVYRLANTADRMTEIITARYKDAIAWLRDVAAAKADVGTLQAAGSDAPISPNEAVIEAADRVMSRRSLRGW